MGLIGGDGPHAIMGMQLWATPDCRVGYAGRVGDDFADSVTKRMNACGVHVNGITKIKRKPTPRAWNLFEDAELDQRQFVLRTSEEQYKANFRITNECIAGIHATILTHCNGIHMLCSSDRVAGMVDSIKSQFSNARWTMWEPSVPCCVNDKLQAFEKAAPLVDILSPNLTEMKQLFEDSKLTGEKICEKLRALGAQLIVLRMGAKGSLVYTVESKFIRVPAYPIQRVVDVTGAGNSYCGGFLINYLQTQDPLEAALHGAVSASFTVEQWGLPDIKSISDAGLHTYRLEQLRQLYDNATESDGKAPPSKPAATASKPSPLQLRIAYSDTPDLSRAKAGAPPIPGDAIPPAETHVSAVISLRLKPNTRPLDIGRLAGKVKVVFMGLHKSILSSSPSYVGFDTSSVTMLDSSESAPVPLFRVHVYFSDTLPKVFQKINNQFIRAEQSIEHLHRKFTVDPNLSLQRDAVRVASALQSAAAAAESDSKTAGAGALASADVLQSGVPVTATENVLFSDMNTNFSGQFNLNTDMHVTQIFDMLGAFGLLNSSHHMFPSGKGPAGFDEKSIPKPFQDAIKIVEKICEGVHSISFCSDSRNVSVALSGMSVADVLGYLRTSPDERAARSARYAFTNGLSQQPLHMITRELAAKHPSLLPLAEFVIGLGIFPVAMSVMSLVVLQRSILYVPSLQLTMTPDAMGLPYEDCLISCADETMLHSWLITAAPRTYISPTSVSADSKQLGGGNPNVPTIVMFHGNAGTISGRIPIAFELYQKLKGDINILMVEYRGYGRNDGPAISETGLIIDAQGALNYVFQRDDLGTDVILYGRSLGGAVSIAVAADLAQSEHEPGTRISIAGIIVENSFTSISDMVGPLLGKVAGPRIKDTWLSLQRVRQLPYPALYLAGLKDELVPPRMMTELFEAHGTQQQRRQMHNLGRLAHGDAKTAPVTFESCDAPAGHSFKRLVTFARGTHNDTPLMPEYMDTLKDFIDAVVEDRSP
jgi:abhydrolase domain-containing protein 13